MKVKFLVTQVVFRALATLAYVATPLIAHAEETPFGYSVHIDCPPSLPTVVIGAWIDFRCTIKNQGTAVLDPAKRFALSYHIKDSKGEMLRFDNPRIGLTTPIVTGDTGSVDVRLFGKGFPGPDNYQLQFDMVHEGVAWFSDGGITNTQTRSVKVERYSSPILPDTLHDPALSQIESSYTNFGNLWWHIDKSLEFAHRELRVGKQVYEGFTAGGGYPQIWIRDCNTTFHAARWFYGGASLDGCIFAHLARQRADGYVFDWVSDQDGADKNSVETDQESSLVQLAAGVIRATGDRNPYTNTKALAGLLKHLDEALAYVWRRKRDPNTGLILGAHTIDWGDVEMHDGAHHTATVTGEDTVWTVDIYDQAMFVLAANALSNLYSHTGMTVQASLWRKRRMEIEAGTRKLLWDEARGYFVMHRHVTPHPHVFEEDDLFPMGGNAVAIEAGIASTAMARRIVDVAIKRQILYGISTISGSLLPPYPTNTFKHQLIKEPWHYQNGGQWDWFGARLILQMYRLGMSNMATEKLNEIAAKTAANGGIYEWETPVGQPRGSSYYAGAAGVLARALVEGYFGIEIQGKEVSVTSRVTGLKEKISLVQKANNEAVGYHYERDDEKKSFTLTIYLRNLSLKHLSVKAPAGFQDVRRSILNGKEVRGIEIKRTGEDVFVSVKPSEPRRSQKLVVLWK